MVGMGLVLPLGLSGCNGDGPQDGEGVVTPTGPLPTFAAVRDGYNARVGRLEKLQCPVTILATTRDKDGKPDTSQAEGFLVVERPWKLALRVDKAGQTLAYLGANEEKVWSFDLTQDTKVAYVATREEARGGRLGGMWALDPAVLMDVLGVMPLPEDEKELARAMAWSPNGRAVRVIRRVSGNFVVMDLSPRTFALVAAMVARSDGSVIAKAAYSSDGEVEVRGDRISRPRMAEAIVVELPEWDQKIRLRLVDAQNPDERLRSRAFDLDELLETYDIDEVRLPPGLEGAKAEAAVKDEESSAGSAEAKTGPAKTTAAKSAAAEGARAGDSNQVTETEGVEP
jgi:hypothetical protein